MRCVFVRERERVKSRDWCLQLIGNGRFYVHARDVVDSFEGLFEWQSERSYLDTLDTLDHQVMK